MRSLISLRLFAVCLTVLLLTTTLIADPNTARSVAERDRLLRSESPTEFHGRRIVSTLDEPILDEGFNGRIFPPDDWDIRTTNQNDPTYTWFAQDYLSPINPHEGYYNAGVLWDSTGAEQDEWIYSPFFSLTEEPDSGITWDLTFRAMMNYYWGVSPHDNYDLQLWLFFSGGTDSSLIWLEDSLSGFDGPEDNFKWLEASVDMVPYADNSNLRLGWRYVGSNGAEGGIDSVKFTTGNIAIPDSSDSAEFLFPVILNVAVFDVDVIVNITHPYVSDLSLQLKSPAGTMIQLVNNAVGEEISGSDMVNTRFDDDAEEAFTYALDAAPYTGSWRPVEPLSTFNDENAAGIWHLVAADGAPGDVGTIDDVAILVNHLNDVVLDADTAEFQSRSSVAITDVNVTLNVTHPMISEMYFILESPDGTQVQLVPKEESINYTGADFIETVFDDEADSSFAFIYDAIGYTGRWQPFGSLSDFNEEIPVGTWLLIGIDHVENELNGTITGFDLEFNAIEPVNENHDSAIPASFSFIGNYPNPFNPSTTLSFELPVSAHVSLIIYNTLGQEVANLLSERKQTGIHHVQFDGVNLASGIYFAVFDTDGFHATHKMMLLK